MERIYHCGVAALRCEHIGVVTNPEPQCIINSRLGLTHVCQFNGCFHAMSFVFVHCLAFITLSSSIPKHHRKISAGIRLQKAARPNVPGLFRLTMCQWRANPMTVPFSDHCARSRSYISCHFRIYISHFYRDVGWHGGISAVHAS